MPSIKVTITPKDYKYLQENIEEWYGLKAPTYYIRNILKEDEDLLYRIARYKNLEGGLDTADREMLLEDIAVDLTGMSWPTGGTSKLKSEEFYNILKERVKETKGFKYDE